MEMGMEGENNRRYALLLAARDSEYVKKVYGGYFNVFVKAFGEKEEDERWDMFRVVDGEFPDLNELQDYDGFIVTGSPYDAYGDDHWILELCFLLQILASMQKRILGICFGHQVLCRALGGKVGKSQSGWDIGLRKVKIVKDFCTCSSLESLAEMPPALSIIECHQDEVKDKSTFASIVRPLSYHELIKRLYVLYVVLNKLKHLNKLMPFLNEHAQVLEVPTGAQVLAFSEKTGVEMFTIGDYILGIQGHPEYTKDILNNLIDRLLNQDSIEIGLAADARSMLEIAEPDRECWQEICKSFLKGLWNAPLNIEQ